MIARKPAADMTTAEVKKSLIHVLSLAKIYHPIKEDTKGKSLPHE